MSSESSQRGEPAFRGIVRVSPTQQVREQLLEAIERGDYAAGQALPSERALCQMFGVSRVSVREAIAGLEAMGIVRVEHGRGCFVSDGAAGYEGPFGSWLETHRGRMVELLKVRGALDELAASEAAAGQDPEALARLREAHQAFQDHLASAEPDTATLVELDVTFHDAVARASGSELLVKLVGELAGHIADSRRLTFTSESQPHRSAGEHGAILNAIIDGDAEAAKAAAGAHVRGVRRLVEAQQ